MPSTLIDPIGAALQGKVAALTVQGQAAKGYWPAPASLDKVPAGVVEPPEASRRDIDASESALGSNDWLLTFPVTLYVLLDEAESAQDAAVDFVEAFIKAVDADQGLGVAGVIEARVVSSEPVVIEDQARALYSYECRCEVLAEHVY